MSDALDLIEVKCKPDGLWHTEGSYWRKLLKDANKSESRLEVVDWDRRGPNEMITLNALRVLKSAERAQF